MPHLRHLNHSFVHGALAYSAAALAPFVQSGAAPVAAFLICVYAGWCRQAWLASFLGGVIVAVAGWMAVGILTSPDLGIGAFFMAAVALLVILPAATAAYLVGKALRALAQRRASR